jgi:NCAIR mutase (PurE)-related protein
MTYPDFYQAWHGQYSTAHPLENQLTDIRSQIQPTDKTYPIAIDAQTLKLETKPSTIAQKFCTKIYRKAGYSDIPTINDAAQIREIEDVELLGEISEAIKTVDTLEALRQIYRTS